MGSLLGPSIGFSVRAKSISFVDVWSSGTGDNDLVTPSSLGWDCSYWRSCTRWKITSSEMTPRYFYLTDGTLHIHVRGFLAYHEVLYTPLFRG